MGRPNVGKSALFNRIVGRRIAIVHDVPGVTRDRVSAEAEWRGRRFLLVDTGGIGLVQREKSSDPIQQAVMQQVDVAIESAQLIILVVDVEEGVMPLDEEVAERLRQSRKTVVVAVNKVDNNDRKPQIYEFASLGFEECYPVSAIHGSGIDGLIKGALHHLPPQATAGDRRDPDAIAQGHAELVPLKLAIVGRPNVGKSSIINSITQSDRVIVSPIPGTTRDSVDVPFEVETEGVRQRYVLIDTAGMRKQRRVNDSIEFFSTKRTEDAIERCDIALLVLDAESGILEQDKKIAGKIVEKKKASILAVNKWDLFQGAVEEAQREAQQKKKKGRKDHAITQTGPLTLAEFGSWVQKKLFFLDYAPVIFTSAASGFHLDRLLEAVRFVASQLDQKIPTALLNRVLRESIEKKQPVSATGERLKFFYATQVKQVPPTFLLFVNREGLFSDAYTKYLGGELRKAFGFEGCLIQLVARPRPKHTEEI